ncbi:Leucine Rich repeat-containing domain protein [Aphelenchoides besseyi]|nr:Leucine Rich repeat-containing domain protein [Aphelenchoides besseyi]
MRRIFSRPNESHDCELSGLFGNENEQLMNTTPPQARYAFLSQRGRTARSLRESQFVPIEIEDNVDAEEIADVLSDDDYNLIPRSLTTDDEPMASSHKQVPPPAPQAIDRRRLDSQLIAEHRSSIYAHRLEHQPQYSNMRLGSRKLGVHPMHPTIQAKQNQMYLITTLLPSQSEQPALINRVLPKELLLRIFSYLDIVSLCRCAQVCRIWNRLAMDGSNWQSVDLFCFQKEIKTSVVENLATRCGGFLKELSLRGCENVHDSAMRSFSAKCPNIEALSLSKCKYITDNTCEYLGRYCHRLMFLDLENCTAITDNSLKFLSEGCTHLNELNISYCTNITDTGIEDLFRGCNNLKSLIAKGCEGLTYACFQGLNKHMTQLQRLNLLSCSAITDETVEIIADSCPYLEFLCISNCKEVTDRGVNALANSCYALKDLELASCINVSDMGFISLSKNCHELERMDLEDCVLITDTALINLNSGCPNLNSLTLSHCENLTDQSLAELCTTHKNCLRVLELDNCPNITDAALEHVRPVQNLERIDLYDCQLITKEAIKKFKQHRPEVVVHAYFAPSTPPVQAQPTRRGICKCCTIL